MDDRFSLNELKKQAYMLEDETDNLNLNFKKIETICEDISLRIKSENPSLALSWKNLANKVYKINQKYDMPLNTMASKIISYINKTEENNQSTLNSLRNLKMSMNNNLKDNLKGS